MGSRRAVRASTPVSLTTPAPPWTRIRSSPDWTAASLTASLAIEMATAASRPWARSQHARYSSRRADSRRSFMSTMRCDTAWFFEMGFRN